MKTIAQQLNVKDFPFVIKDKKGNKIYHENSNGYWEKSEYNENGNEIYYEDSEGVIRDKRIPTMTKKEAEKKFKIKIKN